uniref:ATP synthase F0 subunit 8 n=1 Tax=Amblyomma javanense TaxID=1658007 RepID=A0A4Y5UBW7_9ACAR|nr:ATP synthase F0 subunit 8 [Amblyomma javanense]QDC21267.1 ATP synthase F0 subunit 8 [Amblyomma javanense]
MPQLFPMNWMLISLSILISIMSMNIIIYFFKLNWSILNMKFTKNNQKIQFKW